MFAGQLRRVSISLVSSVHCNARYGEEGFVDPTFITHVRKKLSLHQREAAAVFSGGMNAFSRYERGKTKPPPALITLLRVLDRHPELLDEIKTA